MIDHTSETLLTIRQARHAFPHAPSQATIWRWLLKGARGHVLESVKVGGRRFTSREACHRFIEATSADSGELQRPTMQDRRRSFRSAQATLDHFGVKKPLDSPAEL